ncbi:MAG: serine hydrolase [Bacteroidota bacterium]
MRSITIFLLIAISHILTSCGQNSPDKTYDLVEYNAITTPFNQANVGKIRFTSDVLSKKNYIESDFVSSFEIRENSDLYFTAFFNNSLTNYLHQLDTSLTAGELVKKGNYQFSFYVDDNLLYTENLNIGAGLPEQKNKTTVLHRPLLSSANADSWGRFLWMRFFYRNGGEAALETGTHTLKIEIRPYLESGGLKIGDLIAEGEIKLKMAEPEEVPEKEIAIQPIVPNSEWELSDEQFDEGKIRALNRKIAQNRFKGITSIIVIKEGKLLLEEYFNGADRNTLHDTRSVGKSFASTMTGIALEEDYLKSTNQRLSEFYDLTKFDNYSPKKDSVTLESLLTMSSGFDGSDNDYNSPGNEEKMYPTDNWVKFTLDLPMDRSKNVGEKWDYFTAGVVVLGDILEKSVPGGLEKYADQKLFKPLGISDYRWQYTPQDVANTAGGLQMSSLDYAKYGKFYKNRGVWNGKQLITSDWVEKTMTNHFSETPDQTAYGFLFWNQIFYVNDRSFEAFLCNGNGGNKIIIFNDQPLVIVITATAYGQPYGHRQVDKMLQNYILPAVLD